MAKKTIGISLDSEKWDALQVEAEKRLVSRNALFDIVVDLLLANQPIISEVIDLDKQIKQQKLEEITQKVRKLTNDNDHFEAFGYYPTKPANFVTQVVESKPIEKTWIGSNYNQERKPEPSKQDFSQFMPKKEITPEQWDRIYYNAITELSSGKFSCSICSNSITEQRDEVKRHLHSVHGAEMLKLAKEFGFT